VEKAPLTRVPGERQINADETVDHESPSKLLQEPTMVAKGPQTVKINSVLNHDIYNIIECILRGFRVVAGQRGMSSQKSRFQ
jgi:hypothetical protein